MKLLTGHYLISIQPGDSLAGFQVKEETSSRCIGCHHFTGIIAHEIHWRRGPVWNNRYSRFFIWCFRSMPFRKVGTWRTNNCQQIGYNHYFGNGNEAYHFRRRIRRAAVTATEDSISEPCRRLNTKEAVVADCANSNPKWRRCDPTVNCPTHSVLSNTTTSLTSSCQFPISGNDYQLKLTSFTLDSLALVKRKILLRLFHYFWLQLGTRSEIIY